MSFILMTDEKQTIFSTNELIAIQGALQSQIEDCKGLLKDSSIPQNTKPQITTILEYSKSALVRIDTLLSGPSINPE